MASGRHEAFVRSLGADAFIDYTAQPFEQVAHDMDVVFDLIGGETFERAFATLKSGGFLVTAVAIPKDHADRHGVRVERVMCKPNGKQLASIRDLMDGGKLRAKNAAVMPLAEIRRALELSERGLAGGKIVLEIPSRIRPARRAQTPLLSG